MWMMLCVSTQGKTLACPSCSQLCSRHVITGCTSMFPPEVNWPTPAALVLQHLAADKDTKSSTSHVVFFSNPHLKLKNKLSINQVNRQRTCLSLLWWCQFHFKWSTKHLSFKSCMYKKTFLLQILVERQSLNLRLKHQHQTQCRALSFTQLVYNTHKLQIPTFTCWMICEHHCSSNF